MTGLNWREFDFVIAGNRQLIITETKSTARLKYIDEFADSLKEVFDYFRLRRDLADHTFQMERRDVLVGDGDRVVALTDGVATIRGIDHRWSTVGLYDVIGRQIAACWLLPLDSGAFDAIWSG